jgi:hypothetical protein
MEITRDLFLTDARAPYFTMALASRDLEAHRTLSSLTPAEHERLGEALTAAAATMADVLRAAYARGRSVTGTSSFGCGT